jgi:hypothetical protein
MRLFLQEIGLFLFPSLCFALFLMLSKRDPRHRIHWNGKAIALFMAGLLLAAVSFLYEGLIAPREQGRYVPAHTENGVFVPGQFK